MLEITQGKPRRLRDYLFLCVSNFWFCHILPLALASVSLPHPRCASPVSPHFLFPYTYSSRGTMTIPSLLPWTYSHLSVNSLRSPLCPEKTHLPRWPLYPFTSLLEGRNKERPWMSTLWSPVLVAWCHCQPWDHSVNPLYPLSLV